MEDSVADIRQEQAAVSVVHLTDPTAVGDSIEVLNQDVIKLGKSDFKAKRVTVPFVDCCLIYHWTNSRLRTRTQIHEDFDCYTMLGPKAHGTLDGAELQPFSLITASRGAQGEIIAEREYESVALLVPPAVLEKHMSARGLVANYELPSGADVWLLGAELSKEHFQLGASIAEAAEASPDIFDCNHWARYGAQVEFIDSLLAAMESGHDDPVEADRKGKSYSNIVKTCEDFALSLEGRRPYLAELCAEAHVSERTLQYAFQDVLGMSPLTYLIRLRLHRARDDLRKGDGDSTTVTDVAMNWGFWHFGEFSRSYKNCFGETPSQTLGQSADE